MTADNLDLGKLREAAERLRTRGSKAGHKNYAAFVPNDEADAIADGVEALIARVEAAEKLIGQADVIIERMVSRGIDAEKLQEELKRAAFSHACMPDMVVRGMAAQVQIKDYRRLIVRLVEATPDGMCFDAAAFDEAERIARSTLPTEAT